MVVKPKKTESKPICPHCEKEIEEIEVTESALSRFVVAYICPYCKKILSIGGSFG